MMEDKHLTAAKLVYENENWFKSGALWFFIIAGLSLVNSITQLSGGEFNFFFGLIITRIINAFARGLGPAGKSIAVILSVVIACVFVLIGFLARRRYRRAFVVGMILYAFDGLLSVFVRDWISVAIHLFALYGIYRGLRALGSLDKLATEMSTSPTAGAGVSHKKCQSCGLNNVPAAARCERCGAALKT